MRHHLLLIVPLIHCSFLHDSDATTPDVNTIMTPHLTTSTSHLVDSPLNETYTLPVTEQQTKLAIHLNMSRDSSPEKPPDTPPHQVMLSYHFS